MAFRHPDGDYAITAMYSVPDDAWYLAGDDAKSHPHRISHCAWHALTVAVDRLQCLRPWFSPSTA